MSGTDIELQGKSSLTTPPTAGWLCDGLPDVKHDRESDCLRDLRPERNLFRIDMINTTKTLSAKCVISRKIHISNLFVAGRRKLATTENAAAKVSE